MPYTIAANTHQQHHTHYIFTTFAPVHERNSLALVFMSVAGYLITELIKMIEIFSQLFLQTYLSLCGGKVTSWVTVYARTWYINLSWYLSFKTFCHSHLDALV